MSARKVELERRESGYYFISPDECRYHVMVTWLVLAMVVVAAALFAGAIAWARHGVVPHYSVCETCGRTVGADDGGRCGGHREKGGDINGANATSAGGGKGGVK